MGYEKKEGETMKASCFSLVMLVGKKVRTLREFSGIPEGTMGVVVENYLDGKHEGIMVEWKTSGGHVIRDGFGRDKDFDETQWLEVVEDG
jgi:hypothetical protein